jgi:uncharacterized protein YdeI (YjbR/CyaY-like superfamily)
MKSFSRKIRIIGINPYVSPPAAALKAIFRAAGKDKGPIAVRGTVNGARFTQTLVKYAGLWRLYINGPMLRAGRLKVGDTARVAMAFDAGSRAIPDQAQLSKALGKNKVAKAAFEKLAPHRRKEINRYLASLKTKASLERNVGIVVDHLSGKRVKGLHALLRIKP